MDIIRFTLSYKKKFRKIIEDELNQNQKLEKYYDEWEIEYIYFLMIKIIY